MATSKKRKRSKRAAVMQGAPDLRPMVSVAGIRAFAMSAGDMSVFVMQEVTQVMQAARYKQARAIGVGIDRLLDDGHVSRPEAKDLKTIAKHVLRATRKDADILGASVQVRALYQNMAMSGASSPVALAIASAANASLANLHASTASMQQGVAAAVIATPGNAGVGAVVGGVIGGVIGGIAGGGMGAGLGAAIGAAAGAAIGFCNEKGV